MGIGAPKKKVVTRFMADLDEQYRELISKCADFGAEIAKETAAVHFTYAEIEKSDWGAYPFLLFSIWVVWSPDCEPEIVFPKGALKGMESPAQLLCIPG
jgi:hypothetical protein